MMLTTRMQKMTQEPLLSPTIVFHTFQKFIKKKAKDILMGT